MRFDYLLFIVRPATDHPLQENGRTPRYHEGMKQDAHPSPEFQKFDSLMGKLLSVPHAEMQRREAAYRKQVDANPNRRGPKRKAKPSDGTDIGSGTH
jgi:hypothetical protein